MGADFHVAKVLNNYNGSFASICNYDERVKYSSKLTLIVIILNVKYITGSLSCCKQCQLHTFGGTSLNHAFTHSTKLLDLEIFLLIIKSTTL